MREANGDNTVHLATFYRSLKRTNQVVLLVIGIATPICAVGGFLYHWGAHASQIRISDMQVQLEAKAREMTALETAHAEKATKIAAVELAKEALETQNAEFSAVLRAYRDYFQQLAADPTPITIREGDEVPFDPGSIFFKAKVIDEDRVEITANGTSRTAYGKTPTQFLGGLNQNCHVSVDKVEKDGLIHLLAKCDPIRPPI
jgi:hypothetical protein